MCGIVGYVGKKQVVPVIIEGLRKPVSYTHLDVYKRQGNYQRRALKANQIFPLHVAQ